MQRDDVRFPSVGGERCAGTLFLPDGVAGAGPEVTPRPVVVLGHGLGGTRDMRLPAFAEAFCDDGYVCLVFDYRHFGDSDGEPRQLLDVGRQLADWASAVRYVRGLPACDPDRVVLWGSSFGGGHVLRAGARDGRVAAVIAQCPFTSGPASTLRLDPRASLRLGVRAVRDLVAAARGRPPVMAALAGRRGEAALMTADDAVAGYEAQLEEGTTFRNEVAARFALQIVRHVPGRSVRHLRCPVLVCLCTRDTVAPPGPSRRYAARAADGEITEHPYGHFDIYRGEPFAAVLAGQREFLHRRVPVGAAAA